MSELPQPWDTVPDDLKEELQPSVSDDLRAPVWLDDLDAANAADAAKAAGTANAGSTAAQGQPGISDNVSDATQYSDAMDIKNSNGRSLAQNALRIGQLLDQLLDIDYDMYMVANKYLDDLDTHLDALYTVMAHAKNTAGASTDSQVTTASGTAGDEQTGGTTWAAEGDDWLVDDTPWV